MSVVLRGCGPPSEPSDTIAIDGGDPKDGSGGDMKCSVLVAGVSGASP